MNIFEQILRPFIDFFNAIIGLLQAFLGAVQDLVNSFFETIARLFGG